MSIFVVLLECGHFRADVSLRLARACVTILAVLLEQLGTLDMFAQSESSDAWLFAIL